MAIDFPNSPTVGDTYITNGKQYRWDGTAWGIYGTFSPDSTASDTEPTGVGDGHIWYRSDQSQTLIRYDNTWVEVGSAGGFNSSSTSFPTSLDSGTGFAAVEALQAKVGVDSSAVTSSLDYKVADHASRLTAVEGDVTTLQGGSFSSLNVDSGTLYVDTANNRVGIGTTSPVSVLQLLSATTGNTDFRIGNTISITRIATGYSGDGNTTVTVNTSATGSHTTRSGLLILNGGTGAYTSHALYYYIRSRTSAGNCQLTELGRGFYAFDTATRIQLSLTETTKDQVNMVINQWSTAAGYWYLDYIALGY